LDRGRSHTRRREDAHQRRTTSQSTQGLAWRLDGRPRCKLCERKGVFMKKLVVMMAVVSAIATIIDVSDASAQSWGRRGANVRCTNGGVVQERWYCNLKNAPAGPWNNYRSRGRYKLRPGMEGRRT